MADLDREVLFGNEAFAIGMAQIIAGGALVGGITGHEFLASILGEFGLALFLTAELLALLCSMLAAYYRYLYKRWDLKQKNPTKVERYYRFMRGLLTSAVCIIVSSGLVLVLVFWVRWICANA